MVVRFGRSARNSRCRNRNNLFLCGQWLQFEIRAVHSYAADRAMTVGAASTYNPYRPGYRAGGTETASGEHV